MTENSSQGAVTCLNCGAQSPNSARFCPVCGQALNATQAPSWASPVIPTPTPVAPTPAPLPPAPDYPQPQGYGQPPTYSPPQAYGSVPGYPAGSGYASTTARRHSMPTSVGLGIARLVAVLIIGAVIVSSGGGAHATPTPTATPGTPTATPSLVPTHAKTGFSTTGSLATARHNHTDTALPDGRVLVAGGWDGSKQLASAELYNRATGKFSPTGPMATAREIHTAALLPDGSVLIAGGSTPVGSSWGVVASAELYNRATAKFSPTGPMATARHNHTATALPDGRVLIAGGYDGSKDLASAELCQP